MYYSGRVVSNIATQDLSVIILLLCVVSVVASALICNGIARRMVTLKWRAAIVLEMLKLFCLLNV